MILTSFLYLEMNNTEAINLQPPLPNSTKSNYTIIDNIIMYSNDDLHPTNNCHTVYENQMFLLFPGLRICDVHKSLNFIRCLKNYWWRGRAPQK